MMTITNYHYNAYDYLAIWALRDLGFGIWDSGSWVRVWSWRFGEDEKIPKPADFL